MPRPELAHSLYNATFCVTKPSVVGNAIETLNFFFLPSVHGSLTAKVILWALRHQPFIRNKSI